MGMVKPWYGKEKYWTKQRAKAVAKVEKYNNIIKVCDEEIAKVKQD